MKRPEDFFETITIVEFTAFDKDTHPTERPLMEPFFDATPKQCADFIKKNICETAVITKCTEFTVSERIKHSVKDL